MRASNPACVHRMVKKETNYVTFRTLGMLIAGIGVGMVVVLSAACSSQEADESTPVSSVPATELPAPTASPDPTASPESAPTPAPTATPLDASVEESLKDPWGDDLDTFAVTSFTDNGRKYEIMKILPKDAIRAIFDPNFLSAEEADNQYRETDLVIGVSINGEHRAYNVAYLSGHEIVNDVVGGEPIAVTW